MFESPLLVKGQLKRRDKLTSIASFEALKTVSKEFLKNSFLFLRYRLLKSKNYAGQILGFHRFPRKYCRAISVCDVTDDLCSELEADVHTEPRSLFPRSWAPREFILKIFKEYFAVSLWNFKDVDLPYFKSVS